MDYIDKHLATGSVNERYLPSIRAAMAIGKKLLNKYYTLTDHAEVYRIAMGTLFLIYANLELILKSLIYVVLDPKRKLEYFCSARWEEEWIETARNIVETEFEQGYSHMGDIDDETNSEVVSFFFVTLVLR